MRPPFRREMPIVLTLPLHIERRPRARRGRTRRIVVLALVAFAAALLVAGV